MAEFNDSVVCENGNSILLVSGDECAIIVINGASWHRPISCDLLGR